MATTEVNTVVLDGLKGHVIQVTAKALPRGVAGLKIRGLSEVRCRETTVRVLCAIQSLGISIDQCVHVDVPILGFSCDTTGLDLPIAVAVLRELGVIEFYDDTVYLGELGLNGTVRPIRGIFAAVEAVSATEEPALVVPAANRWEAAAAQYPSACLPIYILDRLSDVLTHCDGQSLEAVSAGSMHTYDYSVHVDSDCFALQAADEAVLQADIEAGKRSILLIGYRGRQHEMVRRMRSWLPWNAELARDATRVHSVAGLLAGSRTRADGYVNVPPLRAPHHSVSEAGLIGTAAYPYRPGELSLAHGGLLLLQDLTEFRAASLQALSRVLKAGTSGPFPASPALVVGTAAPCGCTYPGREKCVCSAVAIDRYRQRLAVLGEFFEAAYEFTSEGLKPISL